MKPVFPYADVVSGDAEGVVELYDPDQGARIKKFDVTRIELVASQFVRFESSSYIAGDIFQEEKN